MTAAAAPAGQESRRTADAGKKMVTDRLQEEHGANHLLDEMDPEDADFVEFNTIRAAVRSPATPSSGPNLGRGGRVRPGRGLEHEGEDGVGGIGLGRVSGSGQQVEPGVGDQR